VTRPARQRPTTSRMRAGKKRRGSDAIDWFHMTRVLERIGKRQFKKMAEELIRNGDPFPRANT